MERRRRLFVEVLTVGTWLNGLRKFRRLALCLFGLFSIGSVSGLLLPAVYAQCSGISTPHDCLPNFAQNPRTQSVRSGNWSDPVTWGGGLPGGKPLQRFVGRRSGSPDAVRLRAAYGELPLSFEVNRGQTDARVRFLSRGSGYTLFLTATEAVFALRPPARAARCGQVKPVAGQKTSSTLLRVKLLGGNRRPPIRALEELPGKSHYFLGKDPRNWRSDIPHYAKVEYREVYPGVTLVYYGKEGQLEFDFIVAPGADPRAIRLGFEGIDRLSLNAQSNLLLHTSQGELLLRAPVLYQEVGGVREAIPGRYVLRGKHEVGFEVAAYDDRRALIIDPALSYSTYLGGWGDDRIFDIAVDSSGSAYVAAWCQGGFPTTEGAFQPTWGGNYDACVTKLSPDGSAFVYSTFLGGSGEDLGFKLAVDLSGSAYVAGWTQGADFPTRNPLQPNLRGERDAFITKLNPQGSALVYSTYLGGNSLDGSWGIAVDLLGSAYVTGFTDSADFPTVNPLQPVYGGERDAFVAKINAAGSALVYSTYLGGTAWEYAQDLAVDLLGNAYVVGSVGSLDFPTTEGAFQPAHGGGGEDAFVAKVNAAGSALVYSSYLGGSEIEDGLGIAADSSGNAYVTGGTDSPDFPTKDPLQPQLAGGLDNFVTKVNPTGSALVYSTYLGGSGDEKGRSIALDINGNMHVTGGTDSTDFPTVDPVQAELHGPSDALIAALNPTGSALVYSTYLGGSGNDKGLGVAVDPPSGSAYVTGWTESTDFPTVNPAQPNFGGGRDGFVAKVTLFTIVSGASFYTVTPCRVLDTRDPDGPWGGPALAAGLSRTFTIAGRCSIPATAKAVSFNVTVTEPSDSGHLSLYPGGTSAPPTSTINYRSGQTRANNAILRLGTTGTLAAFCGQASGRAHLILDVNGYFQ